MPSLEDGLSFGFPVPARTSVLGPVLRRDLADLNQQFLDISLDAGLAGDPRFTWSEPVRCGLLETDAAARARMASSPFSFFELVLPADVAMPAGPGRVAEGTSAGADPAVAGRCMTFVHLALFLAWRLADGAPLATRLALGISPAAELLLNETSASQLVQFAALPGLIRPRWPAHRRYWDLLAGAARRGSDAALQWAQWAGICLLGADLASCASGGPDPGPKNRPSR